MSYDWEYRETPIIKARIEASNIYLDGRIVYKIRVGSKIEWNISSRDIYSDLSAAKEEAKRRINQHQWDQIKWVNDYKGKK
jgi:hypothetical protein